MTPDQAEEFTQAHSQIMAGGWRLILWAQEQGVPKALGLSTADWVNQRLGGYVRLAVEERRAAVAELVEDTGLSQRQAAEVLGVSQKTVDRDRAESFDSESAPVAVTTESDDSPVSEVIDTDADVRRARLLKQAAKGVVTVRDLIHLEPESIAASVGPDDWPLYENTAREVTDWFGRLLSARSKRLKLMGGRK